MILQFIAGLGWGPFISICGAVISAVCFLLSFHLSRRMADRSMNLEAHKMLFDIDRQMIADPKLWAFYDDHAVNADPKLKDESPNFQAKLEAFAYLQLNMFEIILLEVPRPGRWGKRSPSRVWYDFFDDTISRSRVMRSILDRPNSAKIYNAVLLKLYDHWKANNTERAPQSGPSD